VAARVRTEAAAELPTVLAQARQSMPQHVEDEMRGAIGTASVSIGGISLPLPEELVRDLERKLAALVEESVYGVLESLDLSAVVDRLAERAYAMVIDDLSSELGRTPISIRGPLNLRVPVMVKTGR
jgi:hypothetical protein